MCSTRHSKSIQENCHNIVGACGQLVPLGCACGPSQASAPRRYLTATDRNKLPAQWAPRCHDSGCADQWRPLHRHLWSSCGGQHEPPGAVERRARTCMHGRHTQGCRWGLCVGQHSMGGSGRHAQV